MNRCKFRTSAQGFKTSRTTFLHCTAQLLEFNFNVAPVKKSRNCEEECLCVKERKTERPLHYTLQREVSQTVCKPSLSQLHIFSAGGTGEQHDHRWGVFTPASWMCPTHCTKRESDTGRKSCFQHLSFFKPQ